MTDPLLQELAAAIAARAPTPADQVRLADACGLSPGVVRYLITGKHCPSATTAEKLAGPCKLSAAQVEALGNLYSARLSRCCAKGPQPVAELARLSAAIRQAAGPRGLAALAKRCGLPVRWVRYAVRGRHCPHPETVRALAELVPIPQDLSDALAAEYRRRHRKSRRRP